MFRQRAGDFWVLCGRGYFAIQPGTCETVGVRAIFIAPTKLKRFWLLPFIEVHSLSLAFARQLPQGGSRERLRGLVPFTRVLAKIWGCGRFSSPLRKLREFYIPPFIGGLAESLILGVEKCEKIRLRLHFKCGIICVSRWGMPTPQK